MDQHIVSDAATVKEPMEVHQSSEHGFSKVMLLRKMHRANPSPTTPAEVTEKQPLNGSINTASPYLSFFGLT